MSGLKTTRELRGGRLLDGDLGYGGESTYLKCCHGSMKPFTLWLSGTESRTIDNIGKILAQLNL